jgi:hypothetical protein
MAPSARVVCLCAFLCLSICNAADCQEIASAEPLTKSEIFATLPVLAFKKIPIDKVIESNASLDDWKIDENVYIGSIISARQTPISADLKQIYNRKSELILSQQSQFSSQDDKDRKYQLNKFVESDVGTADIAVVPLTGNNQKNRVQVDLEATKYMLAMNNSMKYQYIGSSTKSKEDRSLDAGFARNLQHAYSPITSITASSPEVDKVEAVSNGVQLASLDLPTAVSLLLREGQAGVGKPLVFTATEKQLKVEPSLLREYDIYWLQLAVSPSEDLVDRSTELRYDVSIETPNCMVMALVPVILGTEVRASDKLNAPSVKVGEVEVGEMFSRTVEYKYIKPTILGHGIQTSSFGWIFKDDALDASAKRLFVVVGVPKKAKQIETKMQFAAKLKTYGGLASEWGSTGQTPYTIQLP